MNDNQEQNNAAAPPAAMEDAATSTIWDELNAWGENLPGWQRFIVSHAVRDGTLSSERVEEAFRLFLHEYDLSEEDEALPEIPSSVTGRADSDSVEPLILREIKSLKGVNAIPKSSMLTFAPGLTVIYGHNGAGKSGFARMLSAACFSRSEPTILGNVFSDQDARSPASADIVVDLGGKKAESIPFKVGDEENEALQRISVFDASVARIHIAEENPLGFQPAGFDVFDEVGRVIDLISKKLEKEIEERTKPNEFGKIFLEAGPVADEIALLNAETDMSALRKRGAFGEIEQKRLEEIDKQEKEAQSKSSVDTLKALTAAKEDIETVRKSITSLISQIDDGACEAASRLLGQHQAAISAAFKAGADKLHHPDLKQTGSEEWGTFVDASRTLGQAEKEAYPETGDPCLLCHRPLDEPSASLIKRMWSFLDEEARITVQNLNEEVNAKISALKALATDLLPKDGRIRADLSKITSDLVSELDTFSTTLSERRDAIVTALDQGDIQSIPGGVIGIPEMAIDSAVAKIEAQEKALHDGKFEEIIAQLKAEHIELRQRQALSKSIDDVVSYVRDLQWIKKAADSKRTGLSTRFLTDKQKSLFLTHIEGKYRQRLEHESELLDCSLPFELKTRGSAGQTLRGLQVQGGHRPEDIFSEGEQRALALADFLTEVNLNPASAAIILDDPVTSMDHLRKRKIAIRLASEASERQVIVFTHDLVFLSLLSDHAENAEIPFIPHWVERQNGVPGSVNLEDTPANTRQYRKTTKAKEFLDKAKKASGSEKVDFVRSGAGALRRTLEVAVIHHLFKDVVQRWDEQVRLGALTKVDWSNDLADEIVSLQDDTSRLLEGHSNSDAFAGEMPDIDGLEKLITRVDAVIDKAKQER